MDNELFSETNFEAKLVNLILEWTVFATSEWFLKLSPAM